MSLLMLHYLLICISLHACSARLLQVQRVGGSVYFSSRKETRPAIGIGDEYSRIKGKLILTIGQGTGIATLASYCCGENTVKEKLIPEELDGRIQKSEGKKVSLVSARKVMDDMIKTEEEGRQVRIILESGVGRGDINGEGSMGAEENNDMGEEDTVLVMDYPQPHRKPPVHNNNNNKP